MRRNMILVLAAVSLTGGCGKGAFSANSDVAASADGQELKSEWIADVIHGAKGMKPSLHMAEYLGGLWVDVSLFSQAAVNDKLSDSTIIAESMWWRTLQFQLGHFHDTLVAQRVKVSETQIDSAIKATEWRVAQHILVMCGASASPEPCQSATPAEKAAAKKKAEGLLAKINGGANMGDLVAANSDDPGSKNTRGFYGARPKGVYTPEFEKALWSLAPGKVSGLVSTTYGYHIVRRADDKETAEAMIKVRGDVKDSIVAKMAPKLADEFLTELAKTNDLKVTDQGPALLKGALDDLDAKRKDHSKLATYKGGAFTVEDLVRWIQVALIDPNAGQSIIPELKAAPDSVVKGFITQLANNELLTREAEKAKVSLSKEEWAAEQAEFKAGVDSLKAAMKITDADMKLGGSARTKAANDRVDDYFKRIQAHDGTRLLAPPGMLAWVLRGKYKFNLYPDGLKRAFDLAAARDSTPPAEAPGALKPADGPPPVPGAKADSGPPKTAPVKKPDAPPATKKP